MKRSSLGFAFSILASIPLASAQGQSGAGQALPSQSIVDQAVGGALLADIVRPALGVGLAGVGGAGAAILERTLVGLRVERTNLGRLVTIQPIPESIAGQARPVTYPSITRNLGTLFTNSFHGPANEIGSWSRVQENGLYHRVDSPFLDRRSIGSVSNEISNALRAISMSHPGEVANFKVSFTLVSRNGNGSPLIHHYVETTVARLRSDLLGFSNTHDIVQMRSVIVKIPEAIEIRPAMSLSQIRQVNNSIESAKLRLQALGNRARGLRIVQGVSITAIPAGLVIALSQGASGQTLESCLSSNQTDQRALCAEINALLNSEHLIAPTELQSAVTEQIFPVPEE